MSIPPVLAALLALPALAQPGDIARERTRVDGGEYPSPRSPPPPAIGVGTDAIIFACYLVDHSLVDAVIKRHINQVRYCYERRLPQRPTLEGQVTMRFVLDKDGTLLDAGVAKTTLGDPEVEQCLVERFTEWDWPPGRSTYIVKYPLHFKQVPAKPR